MCVFDPCRLFLSLRRIGAVAALSVMALASACDEHAGGMNPATTAMLAASAQAQPPGPDVAADAVPAVNRSVPVTQDADPGRLTPRSTPAEIVQARLFEEPILPLGAVPTAAQNAALAEALTIVQGRGIAAGLPALSMLLSKDPQTPWAASLELNLGLHFRRSGYFSRCLPLWASAWDRLKGIESGPGKAMADRAIAELIQINAWLGRVEEVDRLLPAVAQRSLTGSAAEKVSQARAGREMMQTRPERSFQCGPYAVARILLHVEPASPHYQSVVEYPSTVRGTNLAEIRDLALKVGLPYQVARRAAGAPIITPAVVHWKLGHFGCLLSVHGDRIAFQDSTLDTFYGRDQSLEVAALDDEASGYFLVPQGRLPDGWSTVPHDEASEVWGRGNSTGFDSDATGPDEPAVGCSGSDVGMPVYSMQLALISLRITDTPVGYAPPKGPAVRFTLAYTQRESQQPAVFTYGNLGHHWTHSWLGYVQDDPTITSGDIPAAVCLPGGGTERFILAPPTVGGAYLARSITYKSGADLTRTGTTSPTFDRTLPDGTRYRFSRSDGSVTNPRRTFLSSVTDPQGNTVTLSYDSQNRLTALTDALGQVTTLTYAHATDPLLVTRVTDPFGRFATIGYDAQGRLASLTDVLGLTSTFGFTGTADVITSMTTPYGTTTFTLSEGGAGQQRAIMATDPLGEREKIEFRDAAPGIPASESVVPAGMTLSPFNLWMNHRNTFSWDKKAMRLHEGDYTKAVIYHWVHNASTTGSVLESIKSPLDTRIWFNYPGQTAAHSSPGIIVAQPSCIARVMPDGTSQVSFRTFNAKGLVTGSKDPLGRETIIEYAANGIDVINIRQRVDAATTVRVASIGYGAVPRVPYSVRDAAGELTSFTYNGAGQLLTVTNPKSETTTLVHTPAGYLDRVLDPGSTPTVFTYDGYGRLRTVTDRDLDVTTFDYDLLDRQVKVTYPDATYEQVGYNRLDAEWIRDRLGRWTRIFTNPQRQTVAVRDPLGRVTAFEWCLCGALGRLIDPQGRLTRFDYDLQGRLLAKTYPDGRAHQQTYDTIGRLTTATDAKGQVTTFGYYRDGRMASVAYSNATVATSGVTYAYDPVFGRLTSAIDGVGATAYDYYPITSDDPSTPASEYTPGAGRLRSSDGPWPNDVVTSIYDKLGRLAGQSINGVASSLAYDNLGRIDSVTNAQGAFDYVYDGTTSRLASVLYPNAQKTVFGYAGRVQGRRLQSIANLKTAAGPNLSTFTYGYDNLGRITTWTRQDDAAATTTYTFGYDRGDQLQSAVLRQGTTTLASHGYAYEPGGSRSGVRTNQLTIAEVANQLNQLVSTSAGGPLEIQGSTNELATVLVNGKAAQVNGDNTFRVEVPASATGSTAVAVTATDANGNAQTRNWRFDGASATPRSFTYDLNGNCTSDGIRTYTWDAADRMVSIEWTPVTGTVRRTELSYNGLGQRVRMVEKTNGAVTSNITYLWTGSSIAEERDSAGGTVTKRYLGNGMMVGSTKYFFTIDRLGSIREITDNSGNIVSRFDYDPYGSRSQVSGTFDPSMGFTGHFHHASGLVLTWFRGYDPVSARWLSRDPIGEAGGTNLYAYVENNPINQADPFGLIGSAQRPEYYAALAWASGTMGPSMAALAYAGQRAAPAAQRCVAALSNAAQTFQAYAQQAQRAFAPQLHHPWPQYLGGPFRQKLAELPRWMHALYHGSLDKLLPRQMGSDFYNNLSNADQSLNLLRLIEYTRAFDRMYGTNLLQSLYNSLK